MKYGNNDELYKDIREDKQATFVFLSLEAVL